MDALQVPGHQYMEKHTFECTVLVFTNARRLCTQVLSQQPLSGTWHSKFVVLSILPAISP